MKDRLFEALKKSTADYAEVRFETNDATAIAYRGKEVDTCSSSRMTGGIVRACVRGGWGLAVFDSLDGMVPEVDCAVIHGCDWDTHVDKARPFVEAGKSVLIDKPIAGNARDLEQFVAWAADGARITGGSALRFCNETRDYLARPAEERGTPHTVLCGCAVDEFNYGIHAYALLSGIMGAGITSVRHLGRGAQRRIQVNWGDGRVGLLVIGEAAGWVPFYATITTEKGVTQFIADSANLYRALLEATLPYLAGETDGAPVAIRTLLESEWCALAAQTSWIDGDREVSLTEVRAGEYGYDGPAFADGYRKAKYPA